jgi:hypothetical protein
MRVLRVLEREAIERFGAAYNIIHRQYHEHCCELKRRRGEWDLDGLSNRVRRYCLAGIERVYTLRMHTALCESFTPDELASHLGQKDPSGARHMKANGSMKGDLWVLMMIEHLDVVVKCFRDEDILDEAFTEGFLEVFMQVRHKELGLSAMRPSAGAARSTNGRKDAGADRSEVPLTRGELACLKQLFINEAWIDAQKIRNEARRACELEAAGKAILDQVFRPSDRDGHSLDVARLRELLSVWGESYLLGVGALLEESSS